MNRDDIVLMGDSRIVSTAVVENGEGMVDIQKKSPQILCDTSKENIEEKSPYLFMVRRSVLEKIQKAQSSLPEGIRFLIKECYRPLEIQRESFDWYAKELKKRNPLWGSDQLYDECCKLVAPVEVAPHSTGGAVDLTLVDVNGMPLDMGTIYDADPSQVEYATYTNAAGISRQAIENRMVLSKSLEQVGFVNYPTEWWHWSYGDKYWAFVSGAANAVYSTQNM